MSADRRGDLEHVDYDRLSATYNHRFAEGADRSGTTEALLALARDLARDSRRAGLYTRHPRILEVGCGTGKWLADLSASSRATPARLFGLDLSTGMLRQARREPPLALVRGRAEQLPFPPASFDGVYCVNAIHHFDRPRAFVAEACRLLRPGGRLAVIGMDPHARRESWYVYRYFQGVYETDLRRFPTWAEVADWMSAEGLAVECRVVDHFHTPKTGRAVLNDPFLRQESCSQLALLSREAYQAGLRRIEAALEEAEAAGETLVFAVDTPLAMISGKL